MSAIQISAVVGGFNFPVMDFKSHSGAYGSVGHVDMTTSIIALNAAKIPLVALSAAATGGLEVGLYVTLEGVSKVRIFGGEYVSGTWDYDRDTVKITARDWAGVLVDQKRVLTQLVPGIASILAPGQDPASTGISTQNQRVSELITSIAKEFSLKPVLNLDGDNDPDAGTVLGDSADDTVFMTVPQSLWAVLNQVARATGYEVYVTPNRELVFGKAGAGAPTLTLSYKGSPPPTGTLPCRSLKIMHNPRRNSSFRVLVLSYDPGTAQVTEGDAYVVGTDLSGSNQQTIQPGLWSGNDANDVTDVLTGQNKKMPLYTFHVDGLTSSQAQQRAVAIATDIAKREFILNTTVDPVPSMIPMQHMRIQGEIDPIFAGQNYYINAFSHEFKMPKGHSKNSGLITTITALDLELEGQGSPLVKKAKIK